MTISRVIAAATLLITGAARADDWPQWMGPTRDGVWREPNVVDALPPGGPKVLWRVPVAGGYAGPAVVGDRVYLTDFVTDSKPTEGKGTAAGVERVRCLDFATGKEVWKREHPTTYTISYNCGPRCTPTVSGGKVYTVGAMGRLLCLDAADGKTVWEHDYVAEYGLKVPVWGCAGHPLLDGERLICVVGGKDSEVVAFSKDTGKELWRSLEGGDEPGYNSPTLHTIDGVRQAVVWTPKDLRGLDPATGKPLWGVPLEPKYAMTIMGAQQDGNVLFCGGVGDVCAAVRVGAGEPTVLWRGDRKTGLFPINATPLIHRGHLYGPNTESAYTCVELATGKRLWETLVPTIGEGKRGRSGTAFTVRNGERFFLFTETGDLIIAKLSPERYEEVSRAHLLEPTGAAFGRSVVWSHPAFAGGRMVARNDAEAVCVSLTKE